MTTPHPALLRSPLPSLLALLLTCPGCWVDRPEEVRGPTTLPEAGRNPDLAPLAPTTADGVAGADAGGGTLPEGASDAGETSDAGGLTPRGEAPLVPGDAGDTTDAGAQAPEGGLFETLFGDAGPLTVSLPAPLDCGIAPGTLAPTKLTCVGAPVAVQKPTLLESAAPPWTHGATIALRGDDVLLLHADQGAVVAVDPATQQVLGTLKVGADPRQLVVTPAGGLWIALGAGRALVRVAAPDPGGVFGAVQVLPMDDEVAALALDVPGKLLYAVLAGSQVVRLFDAGTGKPLGEVSPGPWPVAVTTLAGDRVVVALRDAGFVHLSRVGGALELKAKTPYHVTSAGYARGATDVVAFPEPTHAVATHSRANPGVATDAVGVARLTGTLAGELGKGSGKPAFSQSVTPPYYGAASGPSGPCLSRSVWSGQSWASSHVHGWAFDSEQRPVALTAHPSWRAVGVVFEGSDTVMLIDPLKGEVIRRLITNHGPSGVAFSADGKTAYVNAGHAGRLAAYTIDDGSKWAPFWRCPDWELSLGPSPLTPEQRAGRRLFHNGGNATLSLQGDLSCASCHPRGGEDGVVWLGSMGMRQTPALAGRLAGTAPYNWAGSAESLARNMQLTVHRLQGSGLCAEHLAWLEAWLMTLKAPVRPGVGTPLTKLQKQGKDLFVASGCHTCHVDGTGVDGKRHNVGTASPSDLKVAESLANQFTYVMTGEELDKTVSPSLQALALKVGFNSALLRLDTPSLAGVWRTPPYLHDGSAGTLMEVLERTAGTMGDTATLSEGDRKALVAYLETL